MELRVATWNIAAAHKMLSADRFDYSLHQDVAYFAGQLHRLDPDVICLQESEFNTDDSLTHRFAGELGMPYFSETPGCPSHISNGYQLTTAIIAKKPFTNARHVLLPQPTFELRFKHSDEAVQPYNRYMQLVTFDNFTVGTLHTEPLGAFGRSYEHGEGQHLAHSIDELLVQELETPIIVAADFNMVALVKTLPRFITECRLQEALPSEPTKPQGSHPDHILFSPEWQLLQSGIEHTQSDHYLCWADLELASSR
ncbi:MAG TPA: endonuclease/exonuclease/phosphatase family protein [Candidatus Saccharimonadales bacterium]|nr:endonuclease/exonuclease/phosphatase family protein [Candidatus Saccharimonadales bacterium]